MFKKLISRRVGKRVGHGPGCHCSKLDREFDAVRVANVQASYHDAGPAERALQMVELITKEPIHGMTVLDIGGGMGAIQHGLLAAGAGRATNVEASGAYADAARLEAERRHLGNRITVYHGDFVALAPDIAEHDIVTLDRVVCCYHDMPALVGLSVTRARKLYALAYPRGAWWVRLCIMLRNLRSMASGSQFRMHLHSPRDIDAIVRGAGFRLRRRARTWFWDIVVYHRIRST